MISVRTRRAFLLAAPVVGYGFAWYSHFKFEKNKPATFQAPNDDSIGHAPVGP